ncbi:MAG: nuclear transport factor 2 family protein [Sciscionella sp.]
MTAPDTAQIQAIRERPIEEQIRYLADLAEIRDLLQRYCFLCDARVPHDIASGAFTENAGDDHNIYGSEFTGRDGIESMFTRSNRTTEASAHFVANPLIEIDGDVAHGRTYVTGWHWHHDTAERGNVRPSDWVFSGVYVDRFQRTPDQGWLIADRRVEPLGPGATAHGARHGDYDG